MKSLLHKTIFTAIILVFTISPVLYLSAQSSIGSQLSFGSNEVVSYNNGSVWVSIPSGIPGQDLSFTNGVHTWINIPNGIITKVVTNINGTTAIGGGIIASSSGSPITARGLCWSTSPNPTLANSFITDDSIGKGSFVCTITGLLSGTYYIKAFATNSAGTAYGNEVSFTSAVKPVYDIDGNGYDTVVIGAQTWLKQNLKTTKYRTGDAIPHVISSSAWAILASGAYCNYNNDTNNGNTYGRLYNYYTISNLKGLCPTGWHIPSDAEYTTLTTYLGGEAIAGGKLKEAGITHWASPNQGATNETGFTALGGGYRNGSGAYINFSYNGWLWTSTQYTIISNSWYRYMYHTSADIVRGYLDKKYGFTIRCMKD